MKTKKSEVVEGLKKIYDSGIKDIERRCNEFLRENDMWYGDACWCIHPIRDGDVVVRYEINEHDRNGEHLSMDGTFELNTTWVSSRSDVEKYIESIEKIMEKNSCE